MAVIFLDTNALVKYYHIVKQATSYGLRTLDAMQLAVAKELHSHHKLDNFVGSDAKLLNVVRKEGITCISPEDM